MSLIDGIGLPLSTLLILEHLLQVLLHRLRQLIIRIERRIAPAVHLRVLIVHVHAAAAWEIAIANDQTLLT